MSKKFEYRGNLAATPLAEILATIHRYRVPGIVGMSREKRGRRIFLEEGLVVFAASNEKELGLAAYLLGRSVLDAETTREAKARQARDGLRIGQVLLQMGILTPERLNAAITGQAREILWGAFDWYEGDVLFEVGARRTADFVRLDLPLPEVIREGIRRTTDVKRLVQRLGSAGTVLEKMQSTALTLFTAEERKFYEAADGKRSLQQLCAHGPGSMAENARLLYAFFCFGLLRKTPASLPGARKIQYKTEGGSLGG